MLYMLSSKSPSEVHEPLLDTSLVIPEEIEHLQRVIADHQAGKVDESLFRRFRLQHGIYSMRNQAKVYMVRIRIPTGRLTANQIEALERVTRNYASGYGHITTRQDVQIYQVPLEWIPDLLKDLGQVGLTTRETSGNVVRNVTVDPLSGVATDDVFDVQPYAESTMRLFLRNPLSQNLGRKFKIAFSSSPADRACARINDLGAIARIATIQGQSEAGFSVFVGGGLGANPRLGQLLEPFTPADQLLPTIEAAIRVFYRLGERKNRSKARLKFLIERIGMEAFREFVFEERAILPMVNPFPYPDFKGNLFKENYPLPVQDANPSAENDYSVEIVAFRRWKNTNVIPQKQAGYASVIIRLLGGDITADQLRNLAEIARRFSAGEAFTTISQNILLRTVPEVSLGELYMRLVEIGLGEAGAHTLVDIVSCPGAETCPLAITTSHQLGFEITRRLSELYGSELALWLNGVDLKISGCPNACGHHHIAAIGLHGLMRRISGQPVPHYRLYLGGRVRNGETVFGIPVITLPAWNVPLAVERILALYHRDRSAQGDFYQWLNRIGTAAIEAALRELQNLPDPEAVPQAYQDWGQDIPFRVEIGDNECAA